MLGQVPRMQVLPSSRRIIVMVLTGDIVGQSHEAQALPTVELPLFEEIPKYPTDHLLLLVLTGDDHFTLTCPASL